MEDKGNATVVSEEKTDNKVVVEETNEPKEEVKELYKVWLPANHEGSRKIKLGNGVQFNLNRLDEEDQEAAKKAADYPVKEMMLTKTEVNDFRKHYGFKAEKLSKASAPAPVLDHKSKIQNKKAGG